MNHNLEVDKNISNLKKKLATAGRFQPQTERWKPSFLLHICLRDITLSSSFCECAFWEGSQDTEAKLSEWVKEAQHVLSKPVLCSSGKLEAAGAT